MSIEKVREEYEAWVLSKYPNQHMGRFATGEYHSTVIEDCWQAWQASREALVIELPQALMPAEVDHHSDLSLMYAGSVVAAIEAAGLKAACRSELKTPEPECLGCGTKGYTGNCSQCIPY